eukprot:TRINITY_DN1236_c0_g1_i3.p1 TRINITY_DN1236_c0_g1~~TRINITY_DN1236_c0_g1_i3.p1  ORF type:complete len:806 (+),score=169.91 TRINITY_DN1236_c0_g1_i3:159-2576(+)
MEDAGPLTAGEDAKMYERGYGQGPYGAREVTLFEGFHMNPIVSIGAALSLWGFTLWCALDSDPANEDSVMAKLLEGQSWVTQVWTWLYIASQDYWLFFLVPLVWKFGHVKLGRDDEEPEYSDVSYFAMVFCAGVAIGLIFYGASEPLYHFTDGSNRYNNNGYYTDNEAMQAAMNLTIYHWGLQAWVVYGIVAITMGFLSYRKGLPLSFRATMAPLFGKAAWGWMGDLLDIFTILTIVSGLCTSLGMGATQLVTGFKRLGWVDSEMDEDETTKTAAIVIGVITLCATLSVVCGLDTGIKTVSQTAFGLGNILLVVVFVLDEPWYLCNLIVQSFGYHFQHFLQLGFYTDAFAQLPVGNGHAMDGKGANSAWMDWWTIFYWGWWISWAPFVGTFLARISRGRTIRNVLAYSLGVPLLYCFLWFGTFGGAALRMHQQAKFIEKAGLDLHNNTAHWLHTADYWRGNGGNCYDVPAELICTKETGCPDYIGKYATQAKVTPVCVFASADADGYWFDLMMHYHGIGTILCGISVVTIILYFVTSSDSGSLVVDLIAANGREAHVIQRIFWALSEGAVAITLIMVGGNGALKALRALSIICGLPFTFVMCYMCTSLWRALEADRTGELPRSFAMPLYGGVLDLGEWMLTCGRAPLPSRESVWWWFEGFIVPAAPLKHALYGMKNHNKQVAADLILVVAAELAYLGFILLVALAWGLEEGGYLGFAAVAFLAFAIILAYVRHIMRLEHSIQGNGAEDFFASVFFYPLVLAQIAIQADQPVAPKPKSAGFSPAEGIIVEKQKIIEYVDPRFIHSV